MTGERRTAAAVGILFIVATVGYLYQVTGAGRDFFRLSDNNGNLISNEAYNFATFFVRTGTAQHRLVRDLKSILVDRHIGGRQHVDHSRQSAGLA